jgi:actin-related protein 9
MANQTGKWREEQILIICPGSHTTMAQLGCNELTPPAFRFPTRMFKDEDDDGWRPYHTEKRKRKVAEEEDVNGAKKQKKHDDDDYEYIEDPDSTEGAVYPLQGEFHHFSISKICRRACYSHLDQR